MKVVSLFFACLIFLISCDKKINKEAEQIKSDELIPAGTAQLIEEEVIAPQGDIYLTFDKETNIKRIQGIPGFGKLSKQGQANLINSILKVVPDSKKKSKLSETASSESYYGTCDSLHASAANCPAVIVHYRIACPDGLVFDNVKCICNYPQEVDAEVKYSCFTMFQYVDGQGQGQYGFAAGAWFLHSTGSYPGWCTKVGGTAYVPH